MAGSKRPRASWPKTGVITSYSIHYTKLYEPEFLLRFLVWLLVHAVYRLKVEGDERIPDEGPVLIVANHVSFVDARNNFV